MPKFSTPFVGEEQSQVGRFEHLGVAASLRVSSALIGAQTFALPARRQESLADVSTPNSPAWVMVWNVHRCLPVRAWKLEYLEAARSKIGRRK